MSDVLLGLSGPCNTRFEFRTSQYFETTFELLNINELRIVDATQFWFVGCGVYEIRVDFLDVWSNIYTPEYIFLTTSAAIWSAPPVVSGVTFRSSSF